MRLVISLSFILAILAVAFNRVDSYTVEIPALEYCALVANPAPYDGKEIRLRGIYSVLGKGDSTFFSSACSDARRIWVEFSPTYQSCSPPKAVKTLSNMVRKSGVRWARPHVSVIVLDYKSADVDFVGRFMASNPSWRPELPKTDDLFAPIRPNRERYEFLFNVSCVERVKPVPKGATY